MKNNDFEAVIGLEVHAQLRTESKIFCGCATRFGERPNSNTCPVCLGMPGVLPVINQRVVEYATRAALALRCQVSRRSVFARKNYFYPDLPKGYQISQYELPLAERGWLEVAGEGGERKQIGITRVHLEEDAGKLVHGEGQDSDYSYVDFNRTGVPLIEIVSEPDIRTPEEAGDYLRRLAAILVYLGVCDGKMEEGSLRCDANISVRRWGETGLGVKTELKNMNSFRNVERALKREIERQAELVQSGGKVVQETRLWDPDQGITLPMRSKEEAHDYRYFPEPDLLPLVLEPGWIEEQREKIPELPQEKADRFVRDFGLPEYDAGVLVASRRVAEFFEESVRLYPEPKKVSNWVMGELLRLSGEEGGEEIRLAPEDLVKIIRMVEESRLSGLMGKKVLEESYRTGKDPEKVVAEKGLAQISDESALLKVIEEVIAENPREAERFRAGEEKLLQFFTGQVMKKSRGKANPKRVSELLKPRLGGN